MGLKYANNAKTTLNGAHNSSTTTITVVDGSVFPTLGAGDYFYMTLEDTSLNNEIVKVTARSGNTLTIVRAQNGTTAKSFANADKAEGRVVTAILDDLGALVNGVTPTSAFMALVDDTTNAAMLTTLGISAYVQTLLDDANAGTALTTLGVSSFVQTLLDDTSASAFLTTLGLFGTANTWTATQTFQRSGGNFQFLIDNGGNTNQMASWFSSSDAQWNLQPRASGSLVTGRGLSYNFTSALWLLGGALSISSNDTFGLVYTSTDPGALGPVVRLYHNSASPAASDVVGAINIYGKDSAGNDELYGYIQTLIVSPTNGAETSFTQIGSKTSALRIGSGVYFAQGSATSDMGQNTFNSSGYYINGVAALTLGASTIPAVGAAGGSLFVRNSGASTYGLLAGVRGSDGAGWLQAQKVNGDTDAYPLLLNPNGGAITLGGNTEGVGYGAFTYVVGPNFSLRASAASGGSVATLQFTDNPVTTQWGTLTMTSTYAEIITAGALRVNGKAALVHAGSYTSGQLTASTSAPSGGADGDVWFQYV